MSDGVQSVNDAVISDDEHQTLAAVTVGGLTDGRASTSLNILLLAWPLPLPLPAGSIASRLCSSNCIRAAAAAVVAVNIELAA